MKVKSYICTCIPSWFFREISTRRNSGIPGRTWLRRQLSSIVFHSCCRSFRDITRGVTTRARREQHLWYDSFDTSYWCVCTTACDYEAPCEKATATHESCIMVHNWERVYPASRACNNVTPDLPPAEKCHVHKWTSARDTRHPNRESCLFNGGTVQWAVPFSAATIRPDVSDLPPPRRKRGHVGGAAAQLRFVRVCRPTWCRIARVDVR